MQIDVQCYRWSRNGMCPTGDTTDAYVPIREVERLLEEAHERGYREAKADLEHEP